MCVVQNIRRIRKHTLFNEPYEHRKMSFFASIEYDVAKRFENNKSKLKSRENTIGSVSWWLMALKSNRYKTYIYTICDLPRPMIIGYMIIGNLASFEWKKVKWKSMREEGEWEKKREWNTPKKKSQCEWNSKITHRASHIEIAKRWKAHICAI